MSKSATAKIKVPQTKKPAKGRAIKNTADHTLLAKFLIEIREQTGMSQKKLADKMGTNQTWVWHRESGINKVTVLDFIRWCNACDIDSSAEFKRFTQSLSA